jgi:flagellar hook-length control protein FliK
LAVAIAAKSVAGSKTFDIRLDPPELGRVDVHLTVDNDSKVQATVVADHPHTLELLQRGSQDLERALKDAGLSLSNNSLNFSLKGEGRQGDGGGASMARTRSLTSAVVARAEAANASEINFGSASGRLDIRV